MPSHSLNQCWIIVHLTFLSKLRLYFNKIRYIRQAIYYLCVPLPDLREGLVPFELVKKRYMWWLVTCLVPSHFLYQCWLTIFMTFWTNSMKVYDISHLLPICDMWWLVALWMPSHFMNQCRHIVQWTFWTNSMNVYGMSHLLSMCDTARVCIEVYCLFKLVLWPFEQTLWKYMI